MEKRYEVLDGLPPYGPMYIPITPSGEPNYSQGFVVRFYKSDGTDWVANFPSGGTGRKGSVHEFPGNENLFVLFGGSCYVIDPNETIPVSVLNGQCLAILNANNDRLVLEEYTGFIILEANGEHWRTEKISFDGFKDVKVLDNLISGLSYDPMNKFKIWEEFTYNIDTKILTGGSWPKYPNLKNSC